MLEICLLVIAICSVVGAVANVWMCSETHKNLTKQILQLSDDVRFQRGVAERNYNDALKWKMASDINFAKANGSAFNDLVDQLKTLSKSESLSNENRGFLELLVGRIDAWEKGKVLFGEDNTEKELSAEFLSGEV